METDNKLSPVFIASSALILFTVLFAAFMPEGVRDWLEGAQRFLVSHLSWLYILCVASIFLTVIYLGMSRYGDIKLGPDHSEPRYSYLSWCAMLFSAGMGIGIMFFGVSEPVMHYLSPPIGSGETMAAAKEALNITFFHWGFHPWSIYTLVGLILAYFSYRHRLPLTLRSAMYPLIGKRIWGWIGHCFDVFAIMGTVFGVAASLGYGVTQIASGLEAAIGWEVTTFRQLMLIPIVTCIAALSAVSGVDKGIRRLSELNLLLAISLLLLVFCAGSSDYLLRTFIQNTGNYLSSVIHKTFNLYAYDQTDWMGGWTLLYWAWWLSWSPFVGMFIARISYGRTIREFVLGVMFVPSLFNFLWMTGFGNSALDLIMNQGKEGLAISVKHDVAASLFVFLNQFPFSTLTVGIAIFTVMVFFVTSADSGALVVNLLASGGKDKNPTWQKLYWASIIGVVSMVMFLSGGLAALQTATILTALPFAFILLCTTVGLKKALEVDYLKKQSIGTSYSPGSNPQEDWQSRIENIVSTPRRKTIESFLLETVSQSLDEVSVEFKKQGLLTKVTQDLNSQTLKVLHGDEIDFMYQVRAREYEPPSFTISKIDNQNVYYRAEVFLKEGGQDYDITGYSKEQIIADVLDQYEKHIHFLSLIRK